MKTELADLVRAAADELAAKPEVTGLLVVAYSGETGEVQTVFDGSASDDKLIQATLVEWADLQASGSLYEPDDED